MRMKRLPAIAVVVSGMGAGVARAGECTVTGAGGSPESSEPVDEPLTFPAVIVGR